MEENAERGTFSKLDSVARYRATSAPIVTRIVREECASLPARGAVLEIGSGDGYLRSIHTDEFARRVVLSEPTQLGTKRLRARFPDAAIVRASAEALPFPAGSVAAVLATCVLDVVDDIELVIRECHRVLVPGGVLLHVLDLATDLHALFAELGQRGSCALPNVFTDPLAAPWPEDLLVIPEVHLERLASIASARSIPGAAALGVYREAFASGAGAAVQAFSTISESSVARAALRSLMRETMRRASERERGELAGLEGRPLSSARTFHERLLRNVHDGFTVERAELVRRSATRPLASPSETPRAWRSIVGYVQSGTLPASEVPVEHLEVAVHLFRAVRRA